MVAWKSASIDPPQRLLEYDPDSGKIGTTAITHAYSAALAPICTAGTRTETSYVYGIFSCSADPLCNNGTGGVEEVSPNTTNAPQIIAYPYTRWTCQ
jgi:hypothetical protein